MGMSQNPEFSVGSRREGCILPLESTKYKLGTAGYIFPAGREILPAAGMPCGVK